MKNKKTIIIISVVLGVFLLSLSFFLVLRKKDEKVISAPIPQRSITATTSNNVKIGLGNTVFEKENYETYIIAQTIKLDIIRSLALNNGFKQKISDENTYYLWERGKDLISYDVLANKIVISGINILILEDVNDNIFSDIAKKYFNEDWKYEIFEKNELSGRIEYLAYRKLTNGSYVESRENKNETDRIVIEGGRITSATLTLTNYYPTEEHVPLINKETLDGYINQQQYPKEILPSYDTLNSMMEMGYKEGYDEIAKTLNNCLVEKITVVYYYKNLDQGVLAPVYKALSMCDVVYKKKTYQVPAVIYISAIDPNYILIEDKK